MANLTAEIRQGLIEFLRNNLKEIDPSLKPADVYKFVSNIYEGDLKSYLNVPGKAVVLEFKAFCKKQKSPVETDDIKILDIVLPHGEINGLLLAKLLPQLSIGDEVKFTKISGGFKMEVLTGGKKSSLKNKLFISPETEPVPFSGLIGGTGSAIKSWAGFGKEEKKNQSEKELSFRLMGMNTGLELGFYTLTGKAQINGREYDLYESESKVQVYCLPDTHKILAFKEAGKSIQFV